MKANTCKKDLAINKFFSQLTLQRFILKLIYLTLPSKERKSHLSKNSLMMFYHNKEASRLLKLYDKDAYDNF